MRAHMTAVMAAAIMIAGLMSGCAGSYQARSVDLKGAGTMLVNPDILEKGEEGQALYRYVNPNAVISQYDKILIDPILIYKDAELDASDLENLQKLANNAYVYFRDELAKDYQVVTTPGPRTIRFQFAILDADSSKPVRNLVSSVMPISIGLSLVKLAATGKQIGVGEITIELRATDALTGQLIAAGLDRRVGGKSPSELVDSWTAAESANQYWSKLSRYRACQLRGAGAECDKIKP